MNDVSFLMGPEEGSKQAWVEEKEQGLRKTYPDLERVTLFAFETEPGQLEEALLSPSLFASYTLVVLKHYEELRKDSPVNKTIINFINAPDAPASLVVLSSETAYSLPTAITKALPKDRVQTFWELFENKKQDWIRSFFRREGWDISADAIRLILDMVDNNTLEMKQTCSQLLTFFIVSKKADKQIDSEDISSYLTHTKSEDGFSLFAQVARADLRRSLSSLRRILTTDPRAQMSILTILLRQFRMLESFITLRQALGEEEAFKEASALSSGAVEAKGIRTIRDKDTFRAAASHYSLEEVRGIILLLEESETEVKTASAEEAWGVLSLLLRTVISSHGRKCGLSLECQFFDDPLSYSAGY